MTTNKPVALPIERLFLAITPRLIAVSGPLSDQTIYLDEPLISIGRLSSNDICLDDAYVSRRHCVIRNEGAEYLVEDLGSANGTYLNGERVTAGSLKDGCLIEIGTSRFLFKYENPEETITLERNLFIARNGSSPSGELQSA